MKHNIFCRMAQQVVGMFLVPCSLLLATSGCNDDIDGSPAGGNLIAQVQTGAADASANTLTLHGSVADLSAQAGYEVGFYYGFEEGALVNKVAGQLEGNSVTATLSGLQEGVTVYFQVYLSMGNGNLIRKGEPVTAITTKATIATGEATGSTFAISMKGSSTDAPAAAKAGFVVSGFVANEKAEGGINAQENRDALNKWLTVYADNAASPEAKLDGLTPGMTFYYAAVLDLGAARIYGDIKQTATIPSAKEMKDYENDLVDLGLSTKWCKYNLGCETEGEPGGHFAFGDVTGATISYALGEDYPDEATGDIYKTEYDAAHQASGCLALPSADEWDELFSLCKSEWTTIGEVEGLKFYGATEETKDNYIFLPAAGSRVQSDILQPSYGRYATGSVNGNFCVGYEFSQGLPLHRESFQRYAGLSIRPVSNYKNVPFDKAKLVGKWKLDVNEDGESVYDGAVSFGGKDMNWDYVTCGAPYKDGELGWTAGFAGQDWAYGKVPIDYGIMELTNDGKVFVTQNTVENDAAKPGAKVEGTYTVDEATKTVTLSIDPLVLPSQAGRIKGEGDNPKRTAKVTKLTDDFLEFAWGCDDGNGIAFNYVKEDKYNNAMKSVIATLTATSGGSDGTWNSYHDDDPSLGVDCGRPDKKGEAFYTSYTLEYKGDKAKSMTAAGVFQLDIENFKELVPEGAQVFIQEIKLDGTAVKFDANKFYYGDIEGHGKYRIEFHSIYGCSALDITSAFGSTAVPNGQPDPNASFTTSCEIKFRIVRPNEAPAECAPYFSMQNTSDWSGLSSSSNTPETKIVPTLNDNHQWEVTGPASVTMTATAGDGGFSALGLNFYGGFDHLGWFDGITMEVTDIKNDGTSICGTPGNASTCDLSKVTTRVEYGKGGVKNDGGTENSGADHRFNVTNPWKADTGGANGPFGVIPSFGQGSGSVSALDVAAGKTLSVDMAISGYDKPFAVPTW